MPEPGHAQPTVSVIVPVYNVEEFLPACLESVLHQDYENWRAVVVIDGSPDDSESIARDFAARDERFSVVSVPNGGLGSARNVGLDHSDGEYVFFLDSDDLLPHDALSALMTAALEDDADMVAGRGEDFFGDGSTIRYWTQTGHLFTKGARGTTTRVEPSVLNDHVVWNKVYRRSLIETGGFRFPGRVHCEDVWFSASSALAARTVSVIPDVVYRHRRHDEAISADYMRTKTFRDWIQQIGRAVDVVVASGEPHIIEHYLENMVRVQWWSRAKNFSDLEGPELLAEFEEFTRRIREVSVGGPVKNFGHFFGTLVDSFADGVPSSRWWNEGERVNPLPPSQDTAGVDEALRAIDLLDPSSGIEQRTAVLTLVHRVLRPLALGKVPDAGEETRLRDVAAQVLDRIGPESLHTYLSVPGSESAAGLVAQYVTEQETINPVLVGMTWEPRGAVLRGRAAFARSTESLERMTLVMRSRTTRKAQVVPVTWVDAEPPADEDEPWKVRWQAVVPVGREMLDEEWKFWLRAIRPDGTRTVQLLPGHGVVTEPRTDWELPDGAQYRAIWLRGAGVELIFRQLERGSGHRAAPHRPVERPRIFTYPYWTSNPYMQMLHTEARGRGVVMQGNANTEKTIAELRDPRAKGLVHVQWPSLITDKAVDAADAETKVTAFLDAIRTAKSHGRPFLWTVHNTLPHDSDHLDAAIRLHRGLAELADTVHVLSPATNDLVQPEYVIPPEKTAVIPHSSYHGIYGARLPRAEARAALGAGEDTTGVLFFGQLRPYKGLEHLFDAAHQAAAEGHDLELLLAGKPHPDLTEMLDELQASELAVTAALRFIDDDEVATWFSAADVAVLPYRKILNSGTMHLAATYGVPTVLPDEPHLREEFDGEPWLRYFDAAEPAKSIAALLAEPWYADEEVRASALAYARRRTPTKMSRAYADLVEGMMR